MYYWGMKDTYYFMLFSGLVGFLIAAYLCGIAHPHEQPVEAHVPLEPIKYYEAR